MTFMKTPINRLLLCAVLALACVEAALASTYRRLYGNDMLSSKLVTSICQDSRGYVWIATEYGLNRFDGVYFTQYYADTGEGLANNQVQNVMPCGGGVLVDMYSSVQLYTPDDNRFHDIRLKDAPAVSVKSIVTTPSGDVWLVNSGHGIWQVDLKKMEARPVAKVNRAVGGYKLKSALMDKRGRLWLSTLENGLVMYDTRTNRVLRFLDDAANRTKVAGIMEDAKGRVVVATNNNGIYLPDGRTGAIAKLCDVKGVTVMRSFCDSNGGMYLGTSIYGMWRVDINGRRAVPLYTPAELPLMPRADAWAFCRDKDGNAWIGFHRGGLLFVSQRQQPFGYIAMDGVDGDNGSNVLAVAAAANGSLYVGKEGNGLFELTQSGEVGGRWLHGKGVSAIMPAGGGKVWVGTHYNDGVCLLDTRTGSARWIADKDIVGSYVKGIAADKRGNIYLACFNKGLYSFTPDGLSRRTLCGGRMQLHNRYLNVLKADSRGLLWIGHYYGIDAYDPGRDRVLDLTMDSTMRTAVTYTIAETRDGLMWFGTNHGLFSYDTARRAWKHYTKADGLPVETVCGIAEGGDGSLWVSTFRGLCRLDRRTGRMATFYRGNGLEDDNYLRGACGVSPFGLVYFGNERGLTFFMPQKVQVASFQRGVTITGLYLQGRQVVMPEDAIRLDYRDNTFTLRFSTMDFREADNIYYEYRFKDEPRGVWHQTAAGTSEITLTHLAPGSHQLFVRACEGGVTSDIKKIDIRITPPWWRSWWAYTLYIMAALAVIALAFTAYRRKQQADNNESEIRFLIDVGHELRSPLTLIKSPLDMLLRHGYDQQTDRALRGMKRNTDRMLQLVNQILSIRRIEKGQMRLHYAQTDMTQFVADIVHDYDYEAEKRKITLSFTADGDGLKAYIDRDNFDKVVNNLLTNALKYTQDGGEVTVALAADGGRLRLTVTDNGQGIDEEQLKRVFDRFYQVSSRTASGQLGFGIGLNLTYKLVKLHGGDITARNRTDGQTGSVFTVTLPQGAAHLAKDSIVDGSYFADKTEKDNRRRAESGTAADDEPKQRKPRRATNYRVAVVDDDEGIRSFLASEMGLDYHVDTYANGREALEAVTDTLPDLVVSDVMMPEMDGFTLLRRLKNNTKTSHIPVVLLTTKVEQAARVEGLDYGADAYIDKPFDLEELLATAASLIANRQRVRGKFSGVQEQKEAVKPIELKGNDAQLMEKIMKVVNDRLSDSDFNVEALAADVGLSRVQLHRRVKEMTGITIGEFIRNLRMQQAARLFEQGDITVSQVTYAVGMVNPNHFAAAFKKYFGVTPSEYMAKHAPKGGREA